MKNGGFQNFLNIYFFLFCLNFFKSVLKSPKKKNKQKMINNI